MASLLRLRNVCAAALLSASVLSTPAAAQIDSAATLQAAATEVDTWQAIYGTGSRSPAGPATVDDAIASVPNAVRPAIYYPVTSESQSANLAGTSSRSPQLVVRVSEPWTILLLGFTLFAFGTWMRRPASGNSR